MLAQINDLTLSLTSIHTFYAIKHYSYKTTVRPWVTNNKAATSNSLFTNLFVKLQTHQLFLVVHFTGWLAVCHAEYRGRLVRVFRET
jgi:hypothetical protein